MSSKMNDDQRALLYLFERPYEPLNVPRARGSITYKKEGEVSIMADRFGLVLYTYPNKMMELPKSQQVKKGVVYSPFNPVHLAATEELTQKFMDPQINDYKSLGQVAASVKDHVNEGLFIYALSYAIIRNPAFDSRLVPAIWEVFPNKFIPQDTMNEAMDKIRSSEHQDPEKRDLPEVIEVKHKIPEPTTGSDKNPEFSVAYWREDYGINSHHWHWHLVYPHDLNTHDRRQGELFYYMHNQMLARYDWERLSNKLPRVVGLHNWYEPIPDGYFSKLTINNSSKNYGGRPDNMTLENVKGTTDILGADHDHGIIIEMSRWRMRLADAINSGYMITKDDKHEPLSDIDVEPGKKRGIDILGDAVWAAEKVSVNHDFYGDLHNIGHDRISLIHDPLGHHNEERCVMGSNATAVRDPVFFRWHKCIDDLFQKYKMTQDPYEDRELIFDSVNVESVSVKSDELAENVLETGWIFHDIEVSRGFDFGYLPEEEEENKKEHPKVTIKLQHLTHRAFTYNIGVTNNQPDPLEVTVRVYMAPKLNETGDTMKFMDQRLLWAEMDRYHTTLEPGLNSLERISTDSNITIPPERTFRDIEENPPDAEHPEAAYCGCGWPQHLLLPKGTAEGMDFQIFVLISDWKLDKVEGSAGKKTCSKSNESSFCGILDEKYPDARPMGYPFDRKPNESINNEDFNATDFSQALPNALMSDIKIHFCGWDLNLE